VETRRVFIASALRTPIGRRQQALRVVHAAELLGLVLRESVERSGVPADGFEQVLAGCVTETGDQAYNAARVAWLTAGLPDHVAGTTLDAQCGSSQQAVNLATALIASGAADVIVAGGVEIMSTHPLGSNVAAGPGEPLGRQYRERYEVTSQGESAERIADRWNIDRAECDEIALRSQQLAAQAWEHRDFDAEILPVAIESHDGTDRAELARDEGLRHTTADGLAALKPVFRPDGRLTAGNSSQISDGAAALVLASDRAVSTYGIEPLGEITTTCAVGVDPVMKLTGPIPATRAILSRTGLDISAFDRFEVNEAFASVIGAWRRELRPREAAVNPSGGAIALGHPVGSTGARLCVTAVHGLRRTGGGRALVTMCCGGGLGTATVIEAPA
jgi:acetyl-CoA acetyltransferase family protein